MVSFFSVYSVSCFAFAFAFSRVAIPSLFRSVPSHAFAVLIISKRCLRYVPLGASLPLLCLALPCYAFAVLIGSMRCFAFALLSVPCLAFASPGCSEPSPFRSSRRLCCSVLRHSFAHLVQAISAMLRLCFSVRFSAAPGAAFAFHTVAAHCFSFAVLRESKPCRR